MGVYGWLDESDEQAGGIETTVDVTDTDAGGSAMPWAAVAAATAVAILWVVV
jgi:predicted metal-dependent phosphotriesterase family hydrolase